MRVICIESSSSEYKEAICVHKNSIYNVINTKCSPYKSYKGSNLYYLLLETGGWWQNSSLFREIDDIEEEIEEEIAIEQLY